MTSTHKLAGALGAAVLTAGLMTMTTAAVSADSQKLTGCLVKGEGNSGYLLVNAPLSPASARATERPAEPGTIGTAGTFANIFYWLDNDDSLRPHIGHRIEVEGEIEGDIKEGEIEIDRKDQWTEIEIESDGREMKAQVPNASVVAGPNADRKVEVLVKRVDVEKVRMLDAACR
jgi:hypothetical protein